MEKTFEELFGDLRSMLENFTFDNSLQKGLLATKLKTFYRSYPLRYREQVLPYLDRKLPKNFHISHTSPEYARFLPLRIR